jgi:hypothetical protein
VRRNCHVIPGCSEPMESKQGMGTATGFQIQPRRQPVVRRRTREPLRMPPEFFSCGETSTKLDLAQLPSPHIALGPSEYRRRLATRQHPETGWKRWKPMLLCASERRAMFEKRPVGRFHGPTTTRQRAYCRTGFQPVLGAQFYASAYPNRCGAPICV